MIKKTKTGRTVKSSVNKKHLEDKILYDKEALRTELQTFDFAKGSFEKLKELIEKIYPPTREHAIIPKMSDLKLVRGADNSTVYLSFVWDIVQSINERVKLADQIASVVLSFNNAAERSKEVSQLLSDLYT